MKRMMIAALLLGSTVAQAQSITVIQNRIKATGPKVPVQLVVKNHNDYNQTYNIVRNNKVLKGEITLRPNERRKINVMVNARRDMKTVHRICLRSQPLKTQLNGITLCKNVFTY